MGCQKSFLLGVLKFLLSLVLISSFFWRLCVVPTNYHPSSDRYSLVVVFSFLFAGMGFIWAHVTLGKWKITQAVIFLVISIGYIAVASYFPQQGPAVAWYKDGVLAETMWALPFSGIREVPFLYRVEEEVCSGNTTLQVNLEFTPIRDKSPEYSLKDVGKILRRFIRAQVQAATSYSEEDIVRLKDRLQILPEDLEGEVSTVVKVTVTF